MSSYDLIPAEAYENLPPEPNDQFVTLVTIAQANLGRLLDSSDSGDYVTELRSQYISTVASIAETLGVTGLPSITEVNLADYGQYRKFQVFLSGVMAKVRLRGNLVARPFSVELGRVSKARIQQQIDYLRISIENSDLTEAKKKALQQKLGEFEEELAKQRLGFARTLAITASLMAISGGATTTVTNLPELYDMVTTVVRLIGDDKESEELERLRLAPPTKALPNFSKVADATRPAAFDDDLNEDVPF